MLFQPVVFVLRNEVRIFRHFSLRALMARVFDVRVNLWSACEMERTSRSIWRFSCSKRHIPCLDIYTLKGKPIRRLSWQRLHEYHPRNGRIKGKGKEKRQICQISVHTTITIFLTLLRGIFSAKNLPWKNKITRRTHSSLTRGQVTTAGLGDRWLWEWDWRR